MSDGGADRADGAAVDLDRSYQLSYFVRGPEWAIAIPQGDVDAASDVMRRCSTFWNGVGTLLIPVRRDGRIPKAIDLLLETRPVETFLAHEALAPTATAVIADRFGDVPVFNERYDEREVNLLGLVDVPEGTKPPLNVPVFTAKPMRLATLACWGSLLDEDMPFWHERFDVAYLEGAAAMRALVDGQTEIGSTSPLRLTARRMGLVHARNALDRNNLVVLQDTSFERLVWFWNFRSRVLSITGRSPVIGAPRQLIRNSMNIGGLKAWLAEPPGVARTPNVHVVANHRDWDIVRASLAEIGITEATTDRDTTMYGRDVEAGETTFRFAAQLVGGQITRGARERTLTTLRNPLELDLVSPGGLGGTTGRYVRMTLENLPLALPLTNTASNRMFKGAIALDGLTLRVYSAPRYRISIRFPSRLDALGDWAEDLGYKATPTQDSRYADALLGRLLHPEDLDALATPVAVNLVKALAPRSRPKLVQRLRRELESSGATITEAAIAEQLKDVGLFLEIDALEVSALAGQANTSSASALSALEPLVAAGFVFRGRAATCPACNVTEFLRLDELAEYVACRACRNEFLLPVRGGDRNEPPMMYRLDGLMARAMDQDILPVLLAYRRVRHRLQSANGVITWQGVVLDSGTQKVDIDLLAYNGDQLIFCECKDKGSTLSDAQLEKLLDVTDSCGARPALACLQGDFTDEQKHRVEQQRGFTLTGVDLLA
jgi:hypothetical protein